MHLVSFVRTDRNMVLDVSVRQYIIIGVLLLNVDWMVYLSSDSSLCVCVVCVVCCVCAGLCGLWGTHLYNNMGMTEVLQFEGVLWGHAYVPVIQRLKKHTKWCFFWKSKDAHSLLWGLSLV